MQNSIEDFMRDVDRRNKIYDRQVITESELNSGMFDLFVFALLDNPQETNRVTLIFDRLRDSTKSFFAYMLKRLPCEGGYWDWPPGGAIADPGGLIAWQTPIQSVQDAIATLRQCVTDYWAARNETRDVAPGGPVQRDRCRRTTKNLRSPTVLWSKGVLGPESVLGSIIDCFDEAQLEQDWNACEECDRDRIRKLLTAYRPSEIPFTIAGPPDREWQQERERKYLTLLRLLDLEPSAEWIALRSPQQNGAA